MRVVWVEGRLGRQDLSFGACKKILEFDVGLVGKEFSPSQQNNLKIKFSDLKYRPIQMFT